MARQAAQLLADLGKKPGPGFLPAELHLAQLDLHLARGARRHSARLTRQRELPSDSLPILASGHPNLAPFPRFSRATGGRSEMRIRELVMITVWTASAVAATPATQQAVITVRVRNTAEVPAQTLRRASLEAQRIFHEAGVETEWLLCPPAGGAGGEEAGCHKPHGPADLHLGILPRSMEKDFQVPGSAFGVAKPSLDGRPASYAYVLYGRVADLVKRAKCSEDTVLGHVMAHEVGHLLLGRGHAPLGLMGANWDRQVLLEAARGRLKFSGERARRLQAEAGARNRATEVATGPIHVPAK